MNLLPAKILNSKNAIIVSNVIVISTLLFSPLLTVSVESYERNEQDTWDSELNNPGIAIAELNSTAVKVSCASKCVDDRIKGGFEIKISYNIILADALNFDRAISCTGKIRATSDNAAIDIERCKGAVDSFGTYNDPINKDYAYLHNYCKPHEIIFTSTSQGDFMIIGDLLPHLPYIWSYKIMYQGETQIGEEVLKPICMPESAPTYPPQTDLGSFKVDTKVDDKTKTNISQEEFRSVTLYWRPVPSFLAGSHELRYEVSCFDEDDKLVVYNDTLKDRRIGSLELGSEKILTNSSYMCRLRSVNNLGRSELSSPIYIPKQNSIIDLGAKFNFYVAAITKNEYVLRWNDIEKLMPSQERSYQRSLNKTQSSYYTIYWCQQHHCISIEGMMKTTNTTAKIVIPGDISPQNRIFGISYQNNGKFTGIYWSACVSHPQALNEPLENIRASGNAENSEIIHIGWGVNGCKSILAVNDRYEFNYCHIGPVDPCDPPIMAVPNNLLSETTLNHLNASTLYAIRVRQKVDNQSSNQLNLWSKTTYAHTFPDPAQAQDCSIRQKSTFFLIGTCLVTLLIFTVVWRHATKSMRHCWKLIFHYVQNNDGVEQQLEGMLNSRDSSTDLDQKFWLNRPDPIGKNPLLSSKNCDNESMDKIEQVEANNFDKMNNGEEEEEYVQLQPSLPDYVTYHLGIGQSLDSLSERMEDYVRDPLSDTEDISVTSNSSFLDNVLNADTT